VLFALADLRNEVAGGVFMVQKEVAERLVAEPGGKDFGILAVVMGSVFRIKILRNVPPNVFWPRPEVESAVVSLVPFGDWPDAEFAGFVDTVKALFGQRRKKLRSMWRSLYGGSSLEVYALLSGAGVDPEYRPEQIDPAGWRRLAALAPRRK
jgi:16S rRNA (adenine1518-N6/adenine1519-N6)-dimethyltransferase